MLLFNASSLLFPIFFLLNCCPCGALLFRWLPSTALSDPRNWDPTGSVPCAGDNVRLDAGDEAAAGAAAQNGQNIEVAQLLDGPLQVHKLTLPTNGILYFGNGATEFGTASRAADWQCAKRDQPEDAIFKAHFDAPNFYDFSNWQILPENSAQQMPLRARLDAERVPSEDDQVLFPDEATSKVFIDVPARVRSLNMSGQSFSSRKLWHLLRTIEGQFRIQIGAQIGTDLDAEEDNHRAVAHLHLRWPTRTAFTVVGDDDGQQRHNQRATFFGRPNSNFFEPQFSALCAFVRCVPTEPFCAEPVQPIGQCCAQCGAMLRFRQSSLNYTLSLGIVDEFIRARMPMPSAAGIIGISLARIDKDDFHPLYQISVLADEPANFDESEYCSIMWSMHRKIQQRAVNDHLPLQYQPSDSTDLFDVHAKCSIQLGILHWNTVFRALSFVALLGAVVGIGLHAHYRRSPGFRLYVRDFFSRRHHSLQVTWQRTRERVEMVRNVDDTMDNNNHNDDNDDDGGGGGTSFQAEFANRAFCAKLDDDKKEDGTVDDPQ